MRLTIVRALRALADVIERTVPTRIVYLCGRCRHNMTDCRKPVLGCYSRERRRGVLQLHCCQCARVNTLVYADPGPAWVDDTTHPIEAREVGSGRY